MPAVGRVRNHTPAMTNSAIAVANACAVVSACAIAFAHAGAPAYANVH